jgi:hypothetical protein
MPLKTDICKEAGGHVARVVENNSDVDIVGRLDDVFHVARPRQVAAHATHFQVCVPAHRNKSAVEKACKEKCRIIACRFSAVGKVLVVDFFESSL